jgi:hypothetical protein
MLCIIEFLFLAYQEQFINEDLLLPSFVWSGTVLKEPAASIFMAV